jgi:hypothetical protein
MALPKYPLVNGLRYDWSSVKIKIKGQTYIGVKAVNYKHKLTPGVVKGTTSQVIGKTLGEYEAEAGLEMYMAEWKELRKALGGDGYMAASFDIVVQYSVRTGAPVETDEIRGVSVTEVDKSHTSGNEPLAVKLSLFVFGIIEDGDKPIPDMLGM